MVVLKSKKLNDLLGKILISEKNSLRTIRSINANKATQPVPGNRTLATNLMARAWNDARDLHDVETLGAAKSNARKWASNLLKA